jgi:hypothetical protein
MQQAAETLAILPKLITILSSRFRRTLKFSQGALISNVSGSKDPSTTETILSYFC